ncbi:MAG: peptidoglycan-binding domain-containing protein [Acetivibrionales bacterium]|jgi:peptidoglycan hydrolase-like protein with peptidoglycan-binding domain
MRKRKAAFLPLLAVSIAASFYLSFTPVSAYSQVLKPGMEGSEVTQLQNDLKKLGYFSTESTGYYGDITAEAVEKLQKDNGYIPDGIAGPDTYSLIDKLLKRQEENSGRSITYSSPVLKKGMSGDDVVQLQKMLKELGYFNEECTGYYGDVTVSSVRSLQRQYGYIQDGVAGNDTISLLQRLLDTRDTNGSYKMGMEGKGVAALQNDLKRLGFFNGDCTGYYGELTEAAVKKLQSSHGYICDGIAGKNTLALVDKLLGRTSGTASRGISREDNYLVPWFGEVDKVFSRGKIATVYDIDTGLSFQVKRTFGTNHADVEPLTIDDTNIMKSIYGGKWSWDRRAVVVTVDGRSFAGSMNGMPHAGLDKYPANTVVKGRSGGYGRGQNLDAVKDNGMDGQTCIHFYGSKTHGTARVDSTHQAMVKKAAEWAKKNN